MAITSRDKLMPCLLDRLTDDEPHHRFETAGQRAFTGKRFRTAVLRDLRWLLNARNQDSHPFMREYDEIMTSVLNYGVNDLCGLTFATMDIMVTENQLRNAIIRYEPRIIPQSLQVRVIQETVRQQHSLFGVEISGQLFAEPVPEPLLVRSIVDLESGTVSIES